MRWIKLGADRLPMTKLDPSLLTGLPPFRRLDRTAIREILELSSPKLHPEGSAIFVEGAPAERFHLLLDGYVRVVRTTGEGEHVILLHIPPGELIGIAAALSRTTYPATAIAATDCVALSWPMHLLPTFTERHPGFGAETYRTVGARLAQINETVMDLATRQVDQRVAAALLRLVEQGGRQVGEAVEIDFPITRQGIAEMTGTTLHTVSRLLAAWEKEGLVESRRKRVRVRDAAGLTEKAGRTASAGP